MTFGEKFKAEREKRKLTQQEVADALGINRRMITRYENGISFYNRHLFACVSFLRVKKKADLPERYFVLTLGLSEPLVSDRVAVKTEPYPGRWTTHFVISDPADLDEELFEWVAQAYALAQHK